MELSKRLTAMLTGPGRFRFIVQPIVAILLGIRDGRSDARAGRRAYVISIFFVREGRGEALKSGVKAFIKPFVLSVVLDAVVQFYLFRNVRLWSALLVGTLLIALPYSVARGLTNRILQWKARRRDHR
jgi:hypothetical protein